MRTDDLARRSDDVSRPCELFPAIDLLNGSFVRLAQGDYERRTVYGDDPSTVVSRFIEAGAKWIHIVDLNAARGEGPVNRGLITRLTELAGRSGTNVQTGGGVRSADDAASLFDAGVARVVVGTAAVRTPQVVGEISSLSAGAVAVGLDAHLRADSVWDVAVQGWTQSSGLRLVDVLDQAIGNGASAVVATDIARDGMLTGPSLALYADLLLHRAASGTDFDVIASGGVAGPEDVRALAELSGLDGVIAGRAIYEGFLDVLSAVQICRASRGSRRA